MTENFDPKSFESKWSQKWKENDIYKAEDPKEGEEKFYSLYSFPYPSGDGLHVGHVEGMVANDIAARFARMNGKRTMFPMGWDSFGLPAENFAIKKGIHPNDSTEKAVATFIDQINLVGISIDWSREVGAHRPDYYRWTQWIFLQLYKKGLAYQKFAPVNWCPSCQTALANEQVIDGKCERCDTEVVQKEMKQWLFKITDFADRLDKDLDNVDWPESTKLQQRNWIGKSVGINIVYPIENTDLTITVFTTRPDTNFGATFIVLAPDSQFVKDNIDKFPNIEESKKYVAETAKKTELDRQKEGRTKTGAFTGLYAINRLNNKKLPIYLSDFALANVGTGAVVGVPGHDLRDFQFAKTMGIEVIRVVTGKDGDISEITSEDQIQEDTGTMINSDFLNGLDIHVATQKIMDHIEEQGWGKRITSYRLRDWLVSRQRYWGAPIPIIYDPEGNPHPVPEEDLPVLLPYNVDFKPTGESPLKYSEEFHKSAEEKYGKGWTRETDTLDTFMCSSWYYFRHTDPKNENAFASAAKMNSWLPVDLYMIGTEHIVLHLLYSRFFTKFLYDEGHINFDEPFYKMRHMGTILGPDGRKMSKRWGNIINPNDEIAQFSADTLRMYEMFMGPLEEPKAWSTNGEQGVFRFLAKVWKLQDKVNLTPSPSPEGEGGPTLVGTGEASSQDREINKLIKKVGEDIPNLSFNTAIAKMMEFVNKMSVEKNLSQSVWEKFLLILAPFAPYMTEELWSRIGNGFSIHQQSWPEFDPSLAKDEFVDLPIQVNGKVRAMVKVIAGSEEDAVMVVAMKEDSIKKYVKDTPKKVVFVKDRIMNIII